MQTNKKNKMNKQTKLILGVGVVGVAAYLVWKSQQPKANQTGGVSQVPSCEQQCKEAVNAGTASNYNSCLSLCKEKTAATLNMPRYINTPRQFCPAGQIKNSDGKCVYRTR